MVGKCRTGKKVAKGGMPPGKRQAKEAGSSGKTTGSSTEQSQQPDELRAIRALCEDEDLFLTQEEALDLESSSKEGENALNEASEATYLSAPKTKTSLIWKYFVQILEGTKIECRACGIQYKYYGSTSSAMAHLKEKHGFQEISVMKREATEKTESGKYDAPYQLQCDEKIVALVAEGYLSMNLLSTLAMKELLHTLSKGKYVGMTRQRFASSALPRVFEEHLAGLKSQLTGEYFFSITSDGWSTASQHIALQTYFVHFVDDNFCRVNELIAVTDTTKKQHTAAGLSEVAKNALERVGLCGQRCFGFTTDSARKEAASVKQYFVKQDNSLGVWNPCICHLLNLIVQAACAIPEIKTEIDRVRRIMASIRSSSVLRKEFENAQLAVNLRPPRRAVLDVKTRWNTTVEMLRFYLSRLTALRYMHASGGTFHFDEGASEELTNISKMLSPFELFTKLLSRSDSTISQCLPALAAPRKGLNACQHPKKTLAAKCQAILLGETNRRYEELRKTPSLRAAVALDPLYAFGIGLFTQSEQNEHREALYECMTGQNLFHVIETEAGGSDAPVAKRSRPATPKVSSNPFDFLFASNVENLAERAEDDDPKEQFEKEIASFRQELLSEVVPSIADSGGYALKFWRQMRHQCPKLYQTAKRIFSLPASSVECERLFSRAGMIYSNRLRTLLKGERAEQLLILSYRRVRQEIANLRTLQSSLEFPALDEIEAEDMAIESIRSEDPDLFAEVLATLDDDDPYLTNAYE
ncbi:unnamed protein product, partial [Mesorhabditis spiculigera]